MAGSPARSVDSSMLIDDDDPTITLGGLANANLEPQLVNQCPIAPFVMKPVLTIDEVTAGQAVSFGALPPFLPPDTGFARGDLRQPSWLTLAVLKAEGTGGDAQMVGDATKGLNTEEAVEKEKIQLIDWAPLSPPIAQENLHSEKAQPVSPSSFSHKLQQTINTTITGCGEATGQAGQLEAGEILKDHELQLTVLPHTDAISLDEQALSPVHFNVVAQKLLNDPQFIDRVGCKVFAAQSVPQRQSEHVAGGGARSALVINYSQSLIRYCEVAGLPPPEFRFESSLRGKETLYRATASFGRPSVTFKRPIGRGQYGHKRQVRKDAAQDAWEYLVSSDAILGTGFFVDQQQQPSMSAPRADLGGRLLDRYWQSGNSLPVGNRVAASYDIDSDSKNGADFRFQHPPQRLTTTGGQHETARPQAPLNASGLFRFDRPSPSEVWRAEITTNQPSTASNAPTSRSNQQPGLGFENSSSTASPQPKVTTTNPRRKFHEPSAPSLPVLAASHANRPYILPQKRGRDQFEANGLAKRQLTEIGRALGPHSTNRAATKSMTGLVGSLSGLSGTSATLARVEVICKYVSIQPPQYFEVSRDGGRVQWGARMTPNYLNANGITLGSTVETWNEVLGKTACARQFVEPYLMAGIQLHGFGGGQDAQIDHRGEPVSKRQKVSDSRMDARNYSTVHDEVEELVQGIKEEGIKTEPVN